MEGLSVTRPTCHPWTASSGCSAWSPDASTASSGVDPTVGGNTDRYRSVTSDCGVGCDGGGAAAGGAVAGGALAGGGVAGGAVAGGAVAGGALAGAAITGASCAARPGGCTGTVVGATLAGGGAFSANTIRITPGSRSIS